MVKSHNSPERAIVLGTAADIRRDELATWLTAQLSATPFSLEPASADASFRRLFPRRGWRALVDRHGRAARAGGLQAVRARRAHAAVRPGVNAPEILAQDLDRGFLLLTDFGDHDLSIARSTATNASPLFRRRDRRAPALAAGKPARRCCRRTTKRCCAANARCFRIGMSRATSG